MHKPNSALLESLNPFAPPLLSIYKINRLFRAAYQRYLITKWRPRTLETRLRRFHQTFGGEHLIYYKTNHSNLWRHLANFRHPFFQMYLLLPEKRRVCNGRGVSDDFLLPKSQYKKKTFDHY